MSKVKIDRIVSLLLILFCGFLYVIANGFPKEAESYPKILIILIISLVLILFTGTFSKKITSQENEEEQLLFVDKMKPYITFGLSVIYVFLIDILGFFTSSLLFAVSLMFYLGVRNWKIYVYSLFGMCLFVYFLFEVQFNVQFPHGILF